MLYLDANASVPPLPCAREAAAQALSVLGNPSSPHALGRAARRVLDVAREQLAAALGATPREVFLTSGATESNRWLIDALLLRARTEGRRLVVVTSPLEHPSVRKPLDAASAFVEVRTLPLLDGRLLFPEHLLVDADAVLITGAHNETGLVPELALLLGKIGDTTLLAVDAAQAVARLPVLPARVDAIVSSGHKLGGYAGAGALVLRGRARALAPPWAGGGQEASVRPGTEALVLHAAQGAAASVIDETRAATQQQAPLRDALEQQLLALGDIVVVGAAGARLDNTTALCVGGVDPEALRLAIDAAGVAVGFGAACSALAPEPSPGLVALGLTSAEARATVRLSLPPQIPAVDVDAAVERLVGVIRRLRERRAQRR